MLDILSLVSKIVMCLSATKYKSFFSIPDNNLVYLPYTEVHKLKMQLCECVVEPTTYLVVNQNHPNQHDTYDIYLWYQRRSSGDLYVTLSHELGLRNVCLIPIPAVAIGSLRYSSHYRFGWYSSLSLLSQQD